MYVCEGNYTFLANHHLTISDYIYLECLKISLISEALRSFGYGSGFSCILQEDTMKTDKHVVMKTLAESILPQIWLITSVLPVLDLGCRLVQESNAY